MTLTGRLRTIAVGAAGAGCVLLAAGCGNGSSGLASVGSTATATSQAAAQSTGQAGSTSQSAPTSTAAAASAPGEPLKLAHFPATKDGELARTICQTWSGLRSQYYQRVKADTTGQLSQWFTGSDWTAVRADSLQLAVDPEYQRLDAAVTQATAGTVASTKTGQAVDRACSTGS